MRKFMCVVDSTPECQSALRFAARRAANTGGGVVMVYVIQPQDFLNWAGVADVMARERQAEAEARLASLADEVRAIAGIMPELSVREGDPVEEVLSAIREDSEIGVLVLGAASSGQGPGPLVSQLVAKRGGSMPVPVTVVPGAMEPAQLDAIS